MTPERTDIEAVPPCRILMRDGQPCDEIITQRPRFDETFVRTEIRQSSVPAERTVYLPDRILGRTRKSSPKKPAAASKPDGRQQKRNFALTPDAILGWYREGLSPADIAQHTGAKIATVRGRLIEARASLEFRLEESRLKRCPGCGNGKPPYEAECSRCRRATGVCVEEGCGKRARRGGKCDKHAKENRSMEP